jgi:deazaflavin-dependent oxidoreductase (nitroreductase family)
MPSDFVFKAVNTLHRTMVKVSGGRLGWTGYGMPVVELTTTGRRSGEPRTVMLTAPIHEGGGYVLVGSRGGTDTTPAWVHNIRANPDVTISTKGEPGRKMKAHVADAAERAELWPRITKDFKNYADYQEKTDREIPVVVLEPA